MCIYFLKKENRGGTGGSGAEDLKGLCADSREHKVGLELNEPVRSWSEPRYRVRHVTTWATQVPQPLLFIITAAAVCLNQTLLGEPVTLFISWFSPVMSDGLPEWGRSLAQVLGAMACGTLGAGAPWQRALAQISLGSFTVLLGFKMVLKIFREASFALNNPFVNSYDRRKKNTGDPRTTWVWTTQVYL